jgi:CheY-like chemotaxis protein
MRGTLVLKNRILLVDDEEVIRSTLAALLEQYGYIVTVATSVSEALKRISSGTYDVLLTDLHMPGMGDGLTVVSAMRHANPETITMLLSAFPEMEAATRAIIRQTDQILVKPIEVTALIKAITQTQAKGAPPPRITETVSDILKRSVQVVIGDWYRRILTDKNVMAISMSFEERTGYLPEVFRDLVARLDSSRTIGGPANISKAAVEHGANRRHHGYSPAMLVEESRMLQVCIFETLQNNLATIDFSIVLIGVMTIADEIDSQLSQAMDSYMKQEAA